MQFNAQVRCHVGFCKRGSKFLSHSSHNTKSFTWHSETDPKVGHCPKTRCVKHFVTPTTLLVYLKLNDKNICPHLLAHIYRWVDIKYSHPLLYASSSILALVSGLISSNPLCVSTEVEVSQSGSPFDFPLPRQKKQTENNITGMCCVWSVLQFRVS